MVTCMKTMLAKSFSICMYVALKTNNTNRFCFSSFKMKLRKSLRKTSLKAFSHQRRAKPFNTLRSKSFYFSRQKVVSGQKATSNLTKVFLAKKHFQPKSYFLQISGRFFFLTEKAFLAEKAEMQKAISAKNFMQPLMCHNSSLDEQLLTTEAFETISSGNNLLID